MVGQLHTTVRLLCLFGGVDFNSGSVSGSSGEQNANILLCPIRMTKEITEPVVNLCPY